MIISTGTVQISYNDTSDASVIEWFTVLNKVQIEFLLFNPVSKSAYT